MSYDTQITDAYILENLAKTEHMFGALTGGIGMAGVAAGAVRTIVARRRKP